MKQLVCQCGRFILVDDIDYEHVSKFEWNCQGNGNVYNHLGTGSKKKSRPIGNFILGKRAGFIIDHKDLDSHNNQRDNLRYATKSLNGANRPVNRNNSFGLKGVSLNLGKICSRIRHNGVDIWLGYFDTPIDAAKAYDEKAKELFGEFARLNFP